MINRHPYQKSLSLNFPYCSLWVRNSTPVVNQNLYDDLCDSKIDGDKLIWFRSKEYDCSEDDIYRVSEKIDETLSNINDRFWSQYHCFRKNFSHQIAQKDLTIDSNYLNIKLDTECARIWTKSSPKWNVCVILGGEKYSFFAGPVVSYILNINRCPGHHKSIYCDMIFYLYITPAQQHHQTKGAVQISIKFHNGWTSCQ